MVMMCLWKNVCTLFDIFVTLLLFIYIILFSYHNLGPVTSASDRYSLGVLIRQLLKYECGSGEPDEYIEILRKNIDDNINGSVVYKRAPDYEKYYNIDHRCSQALHSIIIVCFF